MSDALIELTDLGFAWPGQAELLDIPSFTLRRGESLFLKGPSGSGKTTLLGLLGGVQKLWPRAFAPIPAHRRTRPA